MAANAVEDVGRVDQLLNVKEYTYCEKQKKKKKTLKADLSEARRVLLSCSNAQHLLATTEISSVLTLNVPCEQEECRLLGICMGCHRCPAPQCFQPREGDSKEADISAQTCFHRSDTCHFGLRESHDLSLPQRSGGA